MLLKAQNHREIAHFIVECGRALWRLWCDVGLRTVSEGVFIYYNTTIFTIYALSTGIEKKTVLLQE